MENCGGFFRSKNYSKCDGVEGTLEGLDQENNLHIYIKP